jgi:Mg-chelatase subunit ChlD
MKNNRGALTAMAMVLLVLLGATSAWSERDNDPFAAAIPETYPVPIPVTTVSRMANLKPFPSLARSASPERELGRQGNTGVQIELLQVLRSDEIAGIPAPAGMEAVILLTRWTNVHPKQQVPRSSLESGGDRSSGAGGLFSGGSGKEEMVDMDVAYQVPLPSRHLWLIAGGEALPLRPESAQLPDGIVASKAFGIGRLGEAREARMAWFLPKGVADIEFRLFDYDNGHVALPVAGDMKKAESPTQTKQVDAGRSDELELAALGMRSAETYAGQKAADGWRFAVVDLLGKSIATQGKMGALLFADPAKYVWLTGDGGTLHYGLPPEDGSGSLVFTPEVASRQSVTFVVPETEKHFVLRLRGRDSVLTLKATVEPPAAPPATTTQITDKGALTLGLIGVRREGGVTILDLLVSPDSGSKGVEINASQQFILQAGKSELRPDASLTRRLFRQPPEPFILPPATPARFELAFALPASASAPSMLRYRGFSGEASISLDGSRIVEAKAGSADSMSAGALTPVVVPTSPAAATATASTPETIPARRPSEAMPASGGATTKVAAQPQFIPTGEKPKLMAVTLPPLDPATAISEVEPNNEAKQATPLSKALAGKGSLGAGDEYDWYTFEAAGDPQLWSVEADGPGLRGVAIYAAGNRQMTGYDADTKTQVRLDNLLLVPGRYHIRVRGTAQGGEYTVRAVPLGRPDKTAEFEPNDDPSQAQLLRYGEARRGLIDHDSDIDSYRFSLDAPTHILLTLTPPSDAKLLMSIQGGTLNFAGNQLAGPGETSRYEALLQAGEYSVRIKSAGSFSSDTPYELELEYLDPFDLPTDLEPNDTAAQARPLANIRQFKGSAGEFGDWDWFALPEVAQPTRITLTFTGGSGVNLRVAENGRTGSADLKELSRSDSERVYSGTLAPGIPAFLSVSSRGAYGVALTLDPDPAVEGSPTVDPALAVALVGQLPPMAAFRSEQQSQPIRLSVTNHTPTPQRVRLEAGSSADGWRIEPAAGPVDLAPGQSGTLQASLIGVADRAPEARLPVFVRARAERIASAPLELPVQSLCGVPTQSPRPDMPLPESMLGGFNVAWMALGAEPASTSDHQKILFDGMTPVGQYSPIRSFPLDITVKLAGGTTPIAGITLFATPYKVAIGPVPFTLLVSTDGAAYREVIHGEIAPLAREQDFAFPSPVDASHVRLHLEKANGLSDGPITSLAEFKVIAVPGVSPFGTASPNIADPARGGHIVWISWPQDPASVTNILTEAVENRSCDLAPLVPLDLVIGFQHERAARITHLEWQDSDKESRWTQRPDQVAVAASTEGPNGPWQPLANWELKRDANHLARLDLSTPVWARFLRFSIPGTDKGATWQLAETLRVFEEPVGDKYRSILAEWGHYRREAYYERVAAPRNEGLAGAQGPGNERTSARPLAPSEMVSGSVKAGERSDWYRIEIPKGTDRLEFAFKGDGAGRLEPVLEDGKGAPIALETGDEVDGARIFHAKVVPGSSCYLRVDEAKRSIMFVWDESGSIGSSEESIYQSISQMADDINPLVESVNLMPLGEGDVHPLMPKWTSDPLEVKAAIGGYDRSGGSSNAETTLISATKRLAERQGNRIIILLTDAESGGGTLNSNLWQLFRKVEPRIFTFELQAEWRAEYASAYQDKMQDWAAANHGDYRSFQTPADLDHAYERAACLMRRAAEYQVAWKPAPGAGRLSVAWEKGKAMSGATIELILDASGSMKSSKNKVDGKLKIDVAKEVMKQIIELLPGDTQVGVRVYGHRRKDGTRGACEDSELIAPIGKLDRTRLGQQIQSINALGGTPIAYSLQQAGNDLAKIKGPRHIVLITDGKEECKGDPAKALAEIRSKGVDARIDIVGFALADKKDKEDMGKVAGKSGGRFFDAQNRKALAEAINESLAMPFEVLDGREQKVAEGLTGQDTKPLYQGNYTVIVHTANGDVTVRDVSLAEARTTNVILSRDGGRISYRVEAGELAKK